MFHTTFVVGQHHELIQLRGYELVQEMHGLSRKLCFRFDIITEVRSFCVNTLAALPLGDTPWMVHPQLGKGTHFFPWFCTKNKFYLLLLILLYDFLSKPLAKVTSFLKFSAPVLSK
jgi:hypothetical protein